MKVLTRAYGSRVHPATDYPYVMLDSDRWDDFGFKTQFSATLWTSDKSGIDLGGVKVMHLGLEKSLSPLELPERPLPSEYCSLGQATSYYETLLANLDAEQVRAYLVSMRDVVTLTDAELGTFQGEDAFQVSLLRTGGAQRALSDAPALFKGDDLDARLAFDFETQVGGESFVASFLFGDSEDIPSRINAIIGYNGVGKTQFMANLAFVAWQDQHGRSEAQSKYGVLRPERIAFGRVLAISYSAFDTFITPGRDAIQVGTSKTEYVYCGLRDVKAEQQNLLKSPPEIANELDLALARVRKTERWGALQNALAPILREPSFQLSATTLDFQSPTWRAVFDKLSTGHKISLNIIVQLVAQLEKRSLVLADEPESHLHPPLLAALMKGIAEALKETNSFAIIATHSPVVLQEVASRYVQVLRRFGRRTEVQRVPMETFGENVGILTRSVFNLDNAESDYEGILRSLGGALGYEGVLRLFPDGLSSQALGIVMEAELEGTDDASAVEDVDWADDSV